MIIEQLGLVRLGEIPEDGNCMYSTLWEACKHYNISTGKARNKHELRLAIVNSLPGHRCPMN